MKKRRSRLSKLGLGISITLFIIILLLFSTIFMKGPGYYAPPYERTDISALLDQDTFSEEDYAILYAQTGIAKPMIDELKDTADFKERMLRYQNYYFAHVQVKSKPMGPVTFYDLHEDESKEPKKLFELAPYNNGYIFLHRSTHTLGVRHGHAGIVVDATHGKILESLQPGTLSMLQDVEKWTYFPTFRMMRLKNASQEELDEIAAYAKDHLIGIPYSIFTPKNQKDKITITHCSHLVWQAFYEFGIDLDSNKGILVSPRDLAYSDYLETLQIYGVDPSKKW